MRPVSFLSSTSQPLVASLLSICLLSYVGVEFVSAEIQGSPERTTSQATITDQKHQAARIHNHLPDLLQDEDEFWFNRKMADVTSLQAIPASSSPTTLSPSAFPSTRPTGCSYLIDECPSKCWEVDEDARPPTCTSIAIIFPFLRGCNSLPFDFTECPECCPDECLDENRDREGCDPTPVPSPAPSPAPSSAPSTRPTGCSYLIDECPSRCWEIDENARPPICSTIAATFSFLRGCNSLPFDYIGCPECCPDECIDENRDKEDCDPTPVPSPAPSAAPSSTPSSTPTSLPSPLPSPGPSPVPSPGPSPLPSMMPSECSELIESCPHDSCFLPHGDPLRPPDCTDPTIDRPECDAVPPPEGIACPVCCASDCRSDHPMFSLSPDGSPPACSPTMMPFPMPSSEPSPAPTPCMEILENCPAACFSSDFDTHPPSCVLQQRDDCDQIPVPAGCPLCCPTICHTFDPDHCGAPTPVPSPSPSSVPSEMPSDCADVLEQCQHDSCFLPLDDPSRPRDCTDPTVNRDDCNMLPFPNGCPVCCPSECSPENPMFIDGPDGSPPACVPTMMPSPSPTSIPSTVPSTAPSLEPTVAAVIILETQKPSNKPSSIPSSAPTDLPSPVPSPAPSPMPTECTYLVDECPALCFETDPMKRHPPCIDFNRPDCDVLPYDEGSCPQCCPSECDGARDREDCSPTPLPSPIPSRAPTSLPSPVPSESPSSPPTLKPSKTPTESPSAMPSSSPSVKPTSPGVIILETPRPSNNPSMMPSPEPSIRASTGPSATPSETPTACSHLIDECPAACWEIDPNDRPASCATIGNTVCNVLPLPAGINCKCCPDKCLNPQDRIDCSPTPLPSPIPSSVPSSTPTDLPSPLPSPAPSPMPTECSYLIEECPNKCFETDPTKRYPECADFGRPDCDVLPFDEEGCPQCCPAECNGAQDREDCSPTPMPSPKPSSKPSIEPSMGPTATPSETPTACSHLIDECPAACWEINANDRPASCATIGNTVCNVLPLPVGINCGCCPDKCLDPQDRIDCSPTPIPSPNPSYFPSSSDLGFILETPNPTESPSMTPSNLPSIVPSAGPSNVPSGVPSIIPTFMPWLTEAEECGLDISVDDSCMVACNFDVCVERPYHMQMVYTGGGCEGTSFKRCPGEDPDACACTKEDVSCTLWSKNNTCKDFDTEGNVCNNLQQTCEGGATIASACGPPSSKIHHKVFIEAIGGDEVYFAGPVNVNTTWEAITRNAEVEAYTDIFTYDWDDDTGKGRLMQHVVFDSSCTGELVLTDQFGCHQLQGMDSYCQPSCNDGGCIDVTENGVTFGRRSISLLMETEAQLRLDKVIGSIARSATEKSVQLEQVLGLYTPLDFSSPGALLNFSEAIGQVVPPPIELSQDGLLISAEKNYSVATIVTGFLDADKSSSCQQIAESQIGCRRVPHLPCQCPPCVASQLSTLPPAGGSPPSGNPPPSGTPPAPIPTPTTPTSPPPTDVSVILSTASPTRVPPGKSGKAKGGKSGKSASSTKGKSSGKADQFGKSGKSDPGKSGKSGKSKSTKGDSGKAGKSDSGKSNSGKAKKSDSGKSNSGKAKQNDSGKSDSGKAKKSDSGNSNSGKAKLKDSGKSDSGKAKKSDSGKSDSGKAKLKDSGKSDSGKAKKSDSGKSDSGKAKLKDSGKSDSGKAKKSDSGKSDSGKAKLKDSGKSNSGKAKQSDSGKSDSGKAKLKDSGKSNSGKAKQNDSGKSDSGKAKQNDSGKSNSGKAKQSDSGKSVSGKSSSGKSDSGKTDLGKSDSAKADSGKSASGKTGKSTSIDSGKNNAGKASTGKSGKNDKGTSNQFGNGKNNGGSGNEGKSGSGKSLKGDSGKTGKSNSGKNDSGKTSSNGAGKTGKSHSGTSNVGKSDSSTGKWAGKTGKTGKSDGETADQSSQTGKVDSNSSKGHATQTGATQTPASPPTQVAVTLDTSNPSPTNIVNLSPVVSSPSLPPATDASLFSTLLPTVGVQQMAAQPVCDLDLTFMNQCTYQCRHEVCKETPYRMQMRYNGGGCYGMSFKRCLGDNPDYCSCDKEELPCSEWNTGNICADFTLDGRVCNSHGITCADQTNKDPTPGCGPPASTEAHMVYIEAYGENELYFSGPISVNSTWEATTEGEKISTNTAVFTYEWIEGVGKGRILQQALLQSACADDMSAGDQFGSHQLVEFDSFCDISCSDGGCKEVTEDGNTFGRRRVSMYLEDVSSIRLDLGLGSFHNNVELEHILAMYTPSDFSAPSQVFNFSEAMGAVVHSTVKLNAKDLELSPETEYSVAAIVTGFLNGDRSQLCQQVALSQLKCDKRATLQCSCPPCAGADVADLFDFDVSTEGSKPSSSTPSNSPPAGINNPPTNSNEGSGQNNGVSVANPSQPSKSPSKSPPSGKSPSGKNNGVSVANPSQPSKSPSKNPPSGKSPKDSDDNAGTGKDTKKKNAITRSDGK